jgi:hypothetical protein
LKRHHTWILSNGLSASLFWGRSSRIQIDAKLFSEILPFPIDSSSQYRLARRRSFDDIQPNSVCSILVYEIHWMNTVKLGFGAFFHRKLHFL